MFDENVRGPICRNVTIVDDDVYEFEEELTVNLTTNDDSVILDPSGGVMVISDEDSKDCVDFWLFSSWVIKACQYFFLAVVVIGWEEELYEVDESIGQAQLCAIVRESSLAVTLPPLNIATGGETASEGGLGLSQDYIPIPTPDQFVFSVANKVRMCTNTPIVDDILLELTIEDFFADLSFTAGEEPDRVTIMPRTTKVDIRDNDGKCYY